MGEKEIEKLEKEKEKEKERDRKEQEKEQEQDFDYTVVLDEEGEEILDEEQQEKQEKEAKRQRERQRVSELLDDERDYEYERNSKREVVLSSTKISSSFSSTYQQRQKEHLPQQEKTEKTEEKKT